MINSVWEVLLVDDDPDVLSVSKLAMKRFNVYGAPIRVHTATSKAEALDKLHNEMTVEQGMNVAAVGLIDVVMETDTAGLELCEYIREKMGNRLTQLYIRTGQPGVAPERAVIDRLDINGYFSKVELTEDKLYSIVKAGIREYSYIAGAQLVMDFQSAMIQTAGSREQLSGVLNYMISALENTPQGERLDTMSLDLAFFHESTLIAGKESNRGLWEDMKRKPGVPMSPTGDRCVIDGRILLVDIAATETTAPISVVARGACDIPIAELPLYHRFTHTAATLWQLGN